jgi:hypothetical protein
LTSLHHACASRFRTCRATSASNIGGDTTGQHGTQQESDRSLIPAGQGIFAGQELTTVPTGGSARGARSWTNHRK